VNLLALADQFRLKKFMLNLKSILDFHTYNNDGNVCSHSFGPS